MFNIICTNAEAQTNLNKLAKLMCYLLTFVPTNTDLTKPANIFSVDAWRGKLDELANKTEENAMIFLEANREDTNRINRRIEREQHNDDIISDVPVLVPLLVPPLLLLGTSPSSSLPVPSPPVPSPPVPSPHH